MYSGPIWMMYGSCFQREHVVILILSGEYESGYNIFA